MSIALVLAIAGFSGMATYQSLYDIISKASSQDARNLIKGTNIPLSAATVGIGNGGEVEYWYDGKRVEQDWSRIPYTDYAPNASYGPTHVDPNFTREMKERIINEYFGPTIQQMESVTPGIMDSEGPGEGRWAVWNKEPRDIWEVLNAPNAQYLDGYFKNVAGYRANENEPNFMDKYVQPLAAGGLAFLGGMAGGDVLSTLLSSGGASGAGPSLGGTVAGPSGGGHGALSEFASVPEAYAGTGYASQLYGPAAGGFNGLSEFDSVPEAYKGTEYEKLYKQNVFTPGTSMLGATTLASLIDKVSKGGNSSNAQGFQLSDLLRGIPGVVGAIGANEQAKAISELGNKYFGIGAPSRERYEASFKPGFTMSSDPGYQDALDQATRAFTNRNSVGTGMGGVGTAGPNAWSQTLEDLNSKFAFPALQQYRNQNAATGGFGAFNSAVPQFDMGAIAQQGQALSNLGGAAGDIFSPPKKRKLSDLLNMEF